MLPRYQLERKMKPIGEVAKAAVQSRQQLTGSLETSREQLATSAKYAKLLLGCYRVGEANDPETYTRAIVLVFSAFPEDIMRMVCDPRSGLPSRVNWLPTPKEVRDACEAIMGPRRRAHQRQESIKRQLAEREAIDAERAKHPVPEQPKNLITWREAEQIINRRKR